MLRIASRIATDDAIELWLRTKMEEEPEFEISRPKIVVELSSRGFVEVPSRFRLDNESFVYDQVEPLGA